jgi:hypothetical protein
MAISLRCSGVQATLVEDAIAVPTCFMQSARYLAVRGRLGAYVVDFSALENGLS